MDNLTLKVKLQQRLNKLSSNDYDNIETWQVSEAFNKAQVEWVRRQLHGNNIFKEGDEFSKRRILRDPLKKPDFDWGETFCTLIGNAIRIYTNKDFTLVNPVLTYYKRPTYIQFDGVLNPYTGQVSTANVESDFKDDIVELILDEAAAIIAGDIANYNEMQVAQQAAERSN